jgi:4-hydroxy-tetrahydrodipicolinate synthase
MVEMFEGVLPAIITPFKRSNPDEVDFEGLRSNIEFLISQGVHGLVPCGSTGESATLSFKEHEKVIETTVEAVKHRVPVIAGTGSNNTEEAIRLTKAAKEFDVDGVLVISPYYNKPNRSGLIKHYSLNLLIQCLHESCYRNCFLFDHLLHYPSR